MTAIKCQKLIAFELLGMMQWHFSLRSMGRHEMIGAKQSSGKFSPLRYPGGKGKLARFVSELVKQNQLSDGLYVEPYAGGAAVAWELLLTGVVRKVHVNDLSIPVHAFWKSVLDDTESLVRLIHDTEISIENWDRYKAIFRDPEKHEALALGFATFFLNRTNRSGILNGGIIGGRAQTGAWKIDARFNKADLIARIERIAAARRRVTLTNLDAVDLLRNHSSEWGRKTLIYLDPPYFDKGPELYYNFYKNDDHAGVAQAVRDLSHVSWIVSYDDLPPIHCLYSDQPWLQYLIGYSARDRAKGREAMFFSSGLVVPSVAGSMVELGRWEGEEDGTYRPPARLEVA